MADSRTLTFLGTGTSVGVPMIGCDCPVCTSTNPRNHRYRSSVLIGTERGKILIDTTPELRLQLLREKIMLVHAVMFTHYHADHLFGLDDLRLFPKYLNGPLPVYCSAEVETVIRNAFPYVFRSEYEDMPAGAIPKLVMRRIDSEPFEVLGETVTPIPLIHSRYNVFGFRIGDLAYCTDTNYIPESSYERLEGVKTFIIDALRFKPHPAHFSLDEALESIRRVGPETAYLTHMSHDFDYDKLSADLPSHVKMAYDGLQITF